MFYPFFLRQKNTLSGCILDVSNPWKLLHYKSLIYIQSLLQAEQKTYDQAAQLFYQQSTTTL